MTTQPINANFLTPSEYFEMVKKIGDDSFSNKQFIHDLIRSTPKTPPIPALKKLDTSRVMDILRLDALKNVKHTDLEASGQCLDSSDCEL